MSEIGISKDDVRKEIHHLNVKKLSTNGSITTSILKQSVDAYLPYLTDSINYALKESTFRKNLNTLRWSLFTRNLIL